MQKFKVFLFLGLLLSTFNFQLSTAFAVDQWSGVNAAQFLKIPIGARQSAMGEAFSAVSDDISAMCWNPAGLTQVKEKQLAFTHAFWLADTNYDFLGYCQKIRGLGTFGAGISWLSYGTLTGMDNSGGSTADFSAYDLLGIFSYAGNLAPLVSFGLNAKIVRQAVDQDAGSSWAFDAGFLFKSNTYKKLILACVFQNLGAGLQMVNESRPFPYSTKVGASYKFLNDILTVTCDVDIPSNQPASAHFGAEYWQEEIIAFRAGYKTDTISDLGLLSGLSFGMGFRYPLQDKMIINIDYAFVPYGDLLGSHRLSAILKF